MHHNGSGVQRETRARGHIIPAVNSPDSWMETTPLTVDDDVARPNERTRPPKDKDDTPRPCQRAHTHLRGSLSRFVIPMFVIRDPRDTAMQVLDLHTAFGLQFFELLVEVLLDFSADIIGVLRWDEAVR